MKTLIATFLKIAVWLKNFIPPFVLGVIAGTFIWLEYQNLYGNVFAIILVLVGFIGGILFAEKWRKKKGTVEFRTRERSNTANNFKDKM